MLTLFLVKIQNSCSILVISRNKITVAEHILKTHFPVDNQPMSRWMDKETVTKCQEAIIYESVFHNSIAFDVQIAGVGSKTIGIFNLNS